MNFDEMDKGAKVALGGGVLAVVATFLPWVSVAGLASVSGIDGDGVFTLVFGLLVVGIVFARDWEKVDHLATIALGVLVAGVGLLYVSNPAAGVETGSEFGNQLASQMLSPSIGVYLTLVAGIVIVAGGAMGYSNRAPQRQARTPAD